MGVVIKKCDKPTTIYIVGVNDWQNDIDGGFSQYLLTDDYESLHFKSSKGGFSFIETDGTFYVLTKEELLVIKENLQNQDDYDLEDREERVFVFDRFEGELVLHCGNEDTGEDFLTEIPIGISDRVLDYANIPEGYDATDVWITGTPGNYIKTRTVAEVLETLIP